MVSDQTASAFDPGMRALDDPALGSNDEALGNDLWPQRLRLGLPGAGGAIARMAHDVPSDAVGLLDGLGASTAVSGIGVQRLQARDLGAGLGDGGGGRVAVLHAGGGDGDRQQQAKRVDHELRLRPLTVLPASKPVLPPWVVLRVLCPSMMAAVGSGARPMRSRHCWRSRSCMRSKVPQRAQPRKAL